MNWIPLTSEEQFQTLLDNRIAFAVFKHSTRCSISSMVKRRFEEEWTSDVPVYYLDLLEYRNISNQIAQSGGVRHESPQILVFKEGKVVFHASHSAIHAEEIINYLK